jgi:hypothetical protein
MQSAAIEFRLPRNPQGRKIATNNFGIREMSVRHSFPWRMPVLTACLQFLSRRSKVTFVAVLFVLLICLIQPNGLLTDNEEDYFGLAHRFVTGAAAQSDSALFDSSPHRALNEVLLGGLIVAMGYERAQIVARLAVTAAFSMLLYVLFDRFGLSPVDGAIVLAVFGLLHQQIMGGEWLFSGYEAKVAAYAFVMAGMIATMARWRSWTIVLLFVIATYFHFLVGIFWFHAALLWRLIDDCAALKSAIVKAAWFWLAVSPLIAIILWKRWIIDAAIPVPSGLPSPDYIYSILREPWHAAPFVSRLTVASSWLPGCILCGGMLVGALVIAETATEVRLRATARWVALLLIYLLAALALSYFYRRSGILGKFYLFRPSSLLLLIWLAMALAWLNELVLLRPALLLKLVASALVIPAFLAATFLNLWQDMKTRAKVASDKHTVEEFLRGVPRLDAVVLIDPEIEHAFLDIERTTGRAALIMWEFTPTNDPEILEWYRRMEFRRALFQQGCGANPIYSADYLLTTRDRSGALTRSCGPLVLETDRFALLRLHESSDRDAAQH